MPRMIPPLYRRMNERREVKRQSSTVNVQSGSKAFRKYVSGLRKDYDPASDSWKLIDPQSGKVVGVTYGSGETVLYDEDVAMVPGYGWVGMDTYEKYKAAKSKNKKEEEIDQYTSQELAAEAPGMAEVVAEARRKEILEEYKQLQEEAKKKHTSVEVLLRDMLIQKYKEKYGEEPDYGFIHDVLQAQLEIFHALEKGAVPSEEHVMFITDFKNWLPDLKKDLGVHPFWRETAEAKHLFAEVLADVIAKARLRGGITSKEFRELSKDLGSSLGTYLYVELGKEGIIKDYKSSNVSWVAYAQAKKDFPWLGQTVKKAFKLAESKEKILREYEKFVPGGVTGEWLKNIEKESEKLVDMGVPEPLAGLGFTPQEYAAGFVGSFEAWREIGPKQPNIPDVWGAILSSIEESTSKELREVARKTLTQPLKMGFTGPVGWALFNIENFNKIVDEILKGGVKPKLSKEAEWLLEHPVYTFGAVTGETVQAVLVDKALEAGGKALDLAGKEYTKALEQEVKTLKAMEAGKVPETFTGYMKEYAIPKWKRRLLTPAAATDDFVKWLDKATTKTVEKVEPKITVPEKIVLEEINVDDYIAFRYRFKGEKDITKYWVMGSPAPGEGVIKVVGPEIKPGLGYGHKLKLPYTPWESTVFAEGKKGIRTFGFFNREGGEIIFKGRQKSLGAFTNVAEFEIEYPWLGAKTTPLKPKDLDKIGFDLGTVTEFKAVPDIAEQMGKMAMDLLQAPKVAFEGFILPQFSMKTIIMTKKLPKPVLPPNLVKQGLSATGELVPKSEVLPKLSVPPKIAWELEHDLTKVKLEHGATKRLPSLASIIGYHFPNTKKQQTMPKLDIPGKNVLSPSVKAKIKLPKEITPGPEFTRKPRERYNARPFASLKSFTRGIPKISDFASVKQAPSLKQIPELGKFRLPKPTIPSLKTLLGGPVAPVIPPVIPFIPSGGSGLLPTPRSWEKRWLTKWFKLPVKKKKRKKRKSKKKARKKRRRKR